MEAWEFVRSSHMGASAGPDVSVTGAVLLRSVGNSPRMPGIPSSGGEALADPELEVFLASED